MGQQRPIALVTGGAGFIGSNLCQTLLNKGVEVYAVDNLITGQIENLAPFFGNPLFHFDELDIVSPEFVNDFLVLPISEIYHLACPTGVPNIQRFGEEMMVTSSVGTWNTLEIAKERGAKLVYSSSAEVYGDPLVSPQREDYTGNVNPIGPRSPYEEGKRFSEALVAIYTRKYGVQAKIVRIFNTYGPGMSLDDQRVIPRFLQNVFQGKKLVIYGSGEQTRTHLYIDDLIRGLILVMEKGEAGEVYNIGGQEKLTIKELAELVLKVTNSKEGLEFREHFIEDHNGRLPAVDKIKKLGWEQKISLEQGLKQMIYRAQSISAHIPQVPELSIIVKELK